MRRLLELMLFSVVISLIVACGDSPPEPNPVAYSAVNYAFAGPATLPSGLTEITLTNAGTELHHQQLMKLPVGWSPAGFMAALEELDEDAPPPPE